MSAADTTATSPAATTTDATGQGGTMRVRDLHVEVDTPRGWLEVVRGVSFSLQPGRTLGLVGESGSGKSMTAYAMAGLLPRNARLAGGEVWLDDVDLASLGPRKLADIRGVSVGLIFQEPRRSLNPAFTVGDQVSESVRRHRGASRKEARKVALEMLGRVGIPYPERRMDEYPHTFSGGMCQRVMLAMALACKPRVLIADEPTTALDVTVQASVLDLLRELQEEMGLALLLITHDLGVVAEMCDEVAVMYAGRLVERSEVRPVFRTPQHPYTEGLLQSIPDVTRPFELFRSIPGSVPPLHAMPSGCRFHPRCEYAETACAEAEPTLTAGVAGGLRACRRADDLTLQGVDR